MRNTKGKKGITLITLVITVVILLILTGLTIGLIGSGSLVSNSEQVVEQAEIEAVSNKIKIAIANKTINSSKQITIEDIIEQLEDEEIIMSGNGDPSTGQVQTIEKSMKFEIKKDDYGEWNVIYVGESKEEIETSEIVISIEKDITQPTEKVILTIIAKSASGIKSYEPHEGTKKTYDSGIQKVTEYYEVTKNGIYTFKFTNYNGKTESKDITISNISSNLPLVSFEPNGGSGYVLSTESGKSTISTTISVTNEGGNTSQTLQYAWSKSENEEPSNWNTFTNGSTISKTDCTIGTYYLWINVVNSSGNVVTTVSNGFVVSSSTITLTQTPSETNWTNGNVTVNVSYGSYLTQSKTLTCTGTKETDYTINGTTNVVVKTNGRTVEATAKDIAGNIVKGTLTVVNIDKISPSVTFTPNGKQGYMENDTIETKVNVDDGDGSGVGTLKYAWSTSDKTQPTSWVTFNNGSNISKTNCTGGTYYLWIKASDVVGNSDTVVSNKFMVTSHEECVAKINDTYYTTVQNAIDAVPTNNNEVTVEVLKNVTESVTIPSNTNIVLDLVNNTMTGESKKYTITSNGTLKINGGTIISPDSSAIYNKQGGTVDISGGNIIANGYNAINNYGTARISGTVQLEATVQGYTTVKNQTGGIIEISGGKIISTVSNAINNLGTVKISGTVQIEGTSQENYPTLYNHPNAIVEISGGNISGSNSNSIYNAGGTITINGGNVISSGSNSIHNSEGTIMINGGTVSATNGNVINNYGTVRISGTAKIEGTSIENYPTIYNKTGGIVEISGGNITASNSMPIYNNVGTIVISGGTIAAANSHSVYNNGGEITIIGGTITSSSSVAVYNNTEGVIEISGTPNISSDTSVTMYNYSGELAINGGTYTATNGNLLVNFGILTIEGGTVLESTAQGYPTLYNKPTGNITINDATIISTGSNSIYNNDGIMEITNSTIKSSDSDSATIYNSTSGQITILGGEVTILNDYVVIQNRGEMEIGGTVYVYSTSIYPTVWNHSTGSIIITGGTYKNYHESGVFPIYNEEGASMSINGKDDIELG